MFCAGSLGAKAGAEVVRRGDPLSIRAHPPIELQKKNRAFVVTRVGAGTKKTTGIEVTSRETELKAMMAAALEGDAFAYNSLLRELAPQLRAFFRRRSGGDEIAEDLVQETLIAVHTKRATYDLARPFTAWLYAIARYKLADHFRRSHRFTSSEGLEEDLTGPDFEAASLAAIDVAELLDGLPAKQRNAIRATKIEGRSIAEVAAAAGISESDAKMSIYRGLKRLSARVQGKPQ